jgi:hypothetical protein
MRVVQRSPSDRIAQYRSGCTATNTPNATKARRRIGAAVRWAIADSTAIPASQHACSATIAG